MGDDEVLADGDDTDFALLCLDLRLDLLLMMIIAVVLILSNDDRDLAAYMDGDIVALFLFGLNYWKSAIESSESWFDKQQVLLGSTQ